MKKNNFGTKAFVVALLMINIRLPFFDHYQIISDAYTLLQVISLVFLLPIFLKNRAFNRKSIHLLMFYGIYALATFINGGNIATILKSFIPAINLVCGTDLVLLSKHDNILLSVAARYFKILLLANLLSVLVAPGGLYINGDNPNPHYLLGHRNDSIEYALPFLTLLCAKNITSKNKPMVVKGMLLAFALMISTWSVNAVLAMTTVIICMYSMEKAKKNTVLKMLGLYFLAFYTIIILNIVDNMKWLIEDVLGKSITFTGRARIWSRSLIALGKKPLFGYGFESPGVKFSRIHHVNSCHNYVLDYMYYGGVVMLGYVLSLLYVVSKAINSNIRRNCKFLAIIAGYLVIGFATPVHLPTVCLMLFSFLVIIRQSRCIAIGDRDAN